MSVPVYGSVEDLRAAVGVELGPTDWFAVDQKRIDGFADDTEDHQWIHVDPERAADGPFGTTIAHGFLTLSLVPHLLNGVRRLEGLSMGVNYGLNKVRFPSPVPVGSRLRARIKLVASEPLEGNGRQNTWGVTIEREGGDKPVCVAETVSRVYA